MTERLYIHALLSDGHAPTHYVADHTAQQDMSSCVMACLTVSHLSCAAWGVILHKPCEAGCEVRCAPGLARGRYLPRGAHLCPQAGWQSRR